jgi:hypothetical protein
VATSHSLGIEVDVRLNNSQIICQHDPLEPGELFTEWLSFFKHGTLIINVKEEGIERLILEILAEKKVSNFFFLDQSFPFLLKNANQGIRQAAIRVSEYESVSTALKLAGLVDWVWVDIFTKFPLDTESIEALKSAGFKLCVVSPELHGRSEESQVNELQELFASLNFEPDAVCTKRADLWEVDSND